MNFDVIITPAFEQSVIRQAKPIIEAKLNTLRAILVEGFDAPKTGREYRRPSGDRYRASAPGEPPARRSGDLQDSIGELGVREESGTVVGEIRISARHAILLERGTPRISPRPFVRPAIEEFLRRQA